MTKRAIAEAISVASQVGRGLREAQNLFDRLQGDSTGFLMLSQILKSVAGIHLAPNPKNKSLMASRLSSILPRRGLDSYADYAELLRKGEHSVILEFVQSLTTNTTQFFRESPHFDHLKKLLPEIIARKQRDNRRELRVWCAAASTGQEPYTIAMHLFDALKRNSNWKVQLIATDIDLEVLAKAKAGKYNETEIASLPAEYKKRFFQPVIGERGRTFWQVNDELKSMIHFAQLNLIQEKYPFQQHFDIVFCRNVLIYFDSETAVRVVEKLANTLSPGGYLFLGHSETGTMRTQSLTSVAHATYQRRIPN